MEDETPISLEVQKQQAELYKLRAEKEKIEVEKLTAELEYKQALKEAEKKWWAKSKLRQHLISVVLGISIIGFYINYVVVPIANMDNVTAKTQNAIASENLRKKEAQFDSLQANYVDDSLELKRGQKQIDSLYISLKATEIFFRKKLDSVTHNSKLINEFSTAELRKTQKLLENYLIKNKPSFFDSQSNDGLLIKCHFQFPAKYANSLLDIWVTTKTGEMNNVQIRNHGIISLAPGMYNIAVSDAKTNLPIFTDFIVVELAPKDQVITFTKSIF